MYEPETASRPERGSGWHANRLDQPFILLVVAVGVTVSACGGSTVTRRELVEVHNPQMSSDGQVAWFVELHEITRHRGRAIQLQERTAVVLCHADRTPPCARFEAHDVERLGWFREWVESGGSAPPPTPPPAQPPEPAAEPPAGDQEDAFDAGE